jgi:proton glutamate symport protein
MKEGTRVLVALGAAVAGGLTIAASESAALLKAADAIAPIGALWVNAIRMTVIPLVVSLVITGVASTSDVTTIGKLGGRTILVFVLMLSGAALIVMPLAPSLFALLPQGVAKPPLPPGAAEAASELASAPSQTFSAWLTSLIPSNPISAAANGQMIPLILFTLLLALAITRATPAARATLTGFFQALSEAMLVLVRWVVLVAPVGIFALVLPLSAHAGASFVGGIGMYIVAYIAASVVMSLLLYLVVAIVAKVPLRTFARAALPPQLIAFSSSSSIAALPALVESAEKTLELDKKVTGFVLPMAVAMFKFAGPVSWTVGAYFVGWFYGVPISTTGLATIAFAAVFLAFAAPGVPRGAFIMVAPLFAQLGLPVEGVGLLIAVDAIPDTFATVLNTTGNLAAVVLVAKTDRTRG